MTSIPVRQLAWHFKRTVRLVGWPVVAAVALLVTCVVAWYLVLSPLQTRIDKLQQDARTLRVQSRAKLPAQAQALNPSEELAAFYKFFPPKTEISDWMAKLYTAASQQNLILEQGEYRLNRENDGRLVRYEITLPVKGGYIQVRKFVAQALDEVPSLALESISFTRQKVNDPAVDARIRFILYLGAA